MRHFERAPIGVAEMEDQEKKGGIGTEGISARENM